jgi:hypothetical protein
VPPLAAFLIPSERSLGNVGAKPLGKRAIMRCAAAEFVALCADLGVEPWRAHQVIIPRSSNRRAG